MWVNHRPVYATNVWWTPMKWCVKWVHRPSASMGRSGGWMPSEIHTPKTLIGILAFYFNNMIPCCILSNTMLIQDVKLFNYITQPEWSIRMVQKMTVDTERPRLYRYVSVQLQIGYHKCASWYCQSSYARRCCLLQASKGFNGPVSISFCDHIQECSRKYTVKSLLGDHNSVIKGVISWHWWSIKMVALERFHFIELYRRGTRSAYFQGLAQHVKRRSIWTWPIEDEWIDVAAIWLGIKDNTPHSPWQQQG